MGTQRKRSMPSNAAVFYKEKLRKTSQTGSEENPKKEIGRRRRCRRRPTY